MAEILLVVVLVVGLVGVGLQIVLLLRRTVPQVPAELMQILPRLDQLDRALRDEFARSRHENVEAARSQRDELAQTLARVGDAIDKRLVVLTQGNDTRLDTVRQTLVDQLDRVRLESEAAVKGIRLEVGDALAKFESAIRLKLDEQTGQQRSNLGNVNETVARLVETFSLQSERVRESVDQRLIQLQQSNEQKLEQMRVTVDEKLQSTLEARLGASFKLVSERLEQVQKGLGEMQSLASGVGDLKKVLTNVKTRGTWGEVQLGNLLESMLAPHQYEANVAPTGSKERVEYAIRLPGRQPDDAPVWLPIDSKFPKEDYERLVDAQDRADLDAIAIASKALELALLKNGSDISTKYLAPPHTTDFAIMFLPTEGLYAEAVRRTDTVERLQREHRVVVAGPTTFAALLNSLQMGFKTLAIQQRSSEVWEVLGAVKTEFGKFGDVMDKVQKKLNEATSMIEKDVGVRQRAITRKLRDIEAMPIDATAKLLPVDLLPED
jgi:DNA recombination protein RmuC